jgi:hypothetical protein
MKDAISAVSVLKYVNLMRFIILNQRFTFMKNCVIAAVPVLTFCPEKAITETKKKKAR